MRLMWLILVSWMLRSWRRLSALCLLLRLVSWDILLTDLSVCSPILQSMTDNNYPETDSIFPIAKRHESEEILAKTGQPYQINLFSGVEHGFAVRADISKPIIRFAKEAAFTQAVAWFNQYL